MHVVVESPAKARTHPETTKAILAGVGRYGPWLEHGPAHVALPEDEDVPTVGLNRAVPHPLREPRARRRGRHGPARSGRRPRHELLPEGTHAP